mgnify:CR=1 FL=1
MEYFVLCCLYALGMHLFFDVRIIWCWRLILYFVFEFFLLFSLGGTFALYSLLCRHAKIGLVPNQQPVDEELSTYRLEPMLATKGSSVIKTFVERSECFHTGLLITVLLGTSMVIGDGVLTPTISGNHPSMLLC